MSATEKRVSFYWTRHVKALKDIRTVKAIAVASLACMLVVSFCSCSTTSSSTSDATAPSSSAPRRFIIDTDTGADDASALILAATSSDIKIEGVTVLAGNVGLD